MNLIDVQNYIGSVSNKLCMYHFCGFSPKTEKKRIISILWKAVSSCQHIILLQNRANPEISTST